MTNGALCRALIASGAILVATAPALTQGRGQLSALSVLQPGRWQLREVGREAVQPRSLCVPNPRSLMQIQHRDKPCSRLVISDEGRRATVHYTCSGGDFGRTSIRVESSALAVIDTQGIDNGMPFDYRLEARRTGSCSGR